MVVMVPSLESVSVCEFPRQPHDCLAHCEADRCGLYRSDFAHEPSEVGERPADLAAAPAHDRLLLLWCSAVVDDLRDTPVPSTWPRLLW
jgi:hypothetical protein